MTPTTDERNRMSESPGGTFLMTPEQHRARAARLRAQGLEELAQGHENAAKMIERRLARPSGPGHGPKAPMGCCSLAMPVSLACMAVASAQGRFC
jgi:hypothetical protein